MSHGARIGAIIPDAILSIDPGPTESAYVLWNGSVQCFGKIANDKICHDLRSGWFTCSGFTIEMIASYGMPVGREVFETCLWIGRFMEAVNPRNARLVYRKDIKIHLCGSMKAKDGNIRQALIDRVGPQGTKKAPGPTYGISKDVWSALAVAIYDADTRQLQEARG